MCIICSHTIIILVLLLNDYFAAVKVDYMPIILILSNNVLKTGTDTVTKYTIRVFNDKSIETL